MATLYEYAENYLEIEEEKQEAEIYDLCISYLMGNSTKAEEKKLYTILLKHNLKI
jgi:hypothetical protein